MEARAAGAAMSLGTDTETLRRFALAAQRQANALRPGHPQRSILARAAESADQAADEIDALSPEMREDLEIMLASIRPN